MPADGATRSRSPLWRARSAARARLVRTAQGVLRRYGPRPARPAPPAAAPPVYDAARVARWVSGGGTDDTLDYLRMRPFVREALVRGDVTMPLWAHHTDHEPPPPGVVFASVVNDRYAPGLEALLLSLRDVYPGMTNRYVVIHDGGLSPTAIARIAAIHPPVEFWARDPDRYAVALGDHDNHRRIGLLGYLTIDALEICDADHVVVLDADLLVLGDISPLWRGPGIKGVPSAGARPFVVNVRSSGKPVINSGVLAFPAEECGPAAMARARSVLARVDACDDPILVPLADQKFWNLYLEDRDLVVLPQNFNAAKNLLVQHFPHELGAVSVLHLVGNKPWESMLHPSAAGDYRSPTSGRDEPWAHVAAALWHGTYRRLLLRHRVTAFRTDCGAALAADEGALRGGRLAVLSPATGFAAPSGARRAVLLRDLPGALAAGAVVDDVVADHTDLGGWHTPRPELSAESTAALRQLPAAARLWAPYYFRPYLAIAEGVAGRQVSYLLHERPLAREVALAGAVAMDVTAPLDDAGGPVPSVVVPLAAHLGAAELVCGADTLPVGARAADGAAAYAWSVVRAAAAERALGIRVTT